MIRKLEAALQIVLVAGIAFVATVAFSADLPVVKPRVESNKRVAPLSGLEILQLRNFLKDVNCSDAPTGCKGIGAAPLIEEERKK